MRLRLQEIAKKLHKSISDIARETGLNRNTITALYHNKVGGIQFDTLEKISQVYNIPITEIFEENDGGVLSPNQPQKLYRQDGIAVPFTAWAPAMPTTRSLQKEYGYDLDFLYCFYKNQHGWFFWPQDEAYLIAQKMYAHLDTPTSFHDYQSRLYVDAENIASLFKKLQRHTIRLDDERSIISLFRDVITYY